jgi:AraC-like DNA-binding protein
VEVSAGDGFIVRSLAVSYSDGFVLAPHSHDWAQLVYARSGVMHVMSGHHIWFVPPTRAIWIPEGLEHSIAMKGEVALRTLYVEPAICARLKRGLGALEVSPLLGELILHILTTRMLDPAIAEHDRLAGVLIDLIGAAHAMDLSLPLPKDARALRLAERIRGEPAEKSDLETLAKTTGASLRTLQRHFSEETGLSIEAWRQKARLVHSAAALATGASVTDAAIDCGYDSPSAYISAFRKQFGVTPGRFKPD